MPFMIQGAQPLRHFGRDAPRDPGKVPALVEALCDLSSRVSLSSGIGVDE